MQSRTFEGQQWPYIAEAFSVRHTVFTREQGFPVEIDVDEYDDNAFHIVIYDEKQPVATARLIIIDDNQAKIGRMAVLPAWRKKGVGHQIMQSLIQTAKTKQIKTIQITAQVQVQAFYEKLGFEAEGNPYMLKGNEHILMNYKICRKVWL